MTYNERSVVLRGEPKLLFSGAVHYARVLPADWPRVLDLAARMGLNTIQTYVMWNFHEHERGTTMSVVVVVVLTGFGLGVPRQARERELEFVLARRRRFGEATLYIRRGPLISEAERGHGG